MTMPTIVYIAALGAFALVALWAVRDANAAVEQTRNDPQTARGDQASREDPLRALLRWLDEMKRRNPSQAVEGARHVISQAPKWGPELLGELMESDPPRSMVRDAISVYGPDEVFRRVLEWCRATVQDAENRRADYETAKARAKAEARRRAREQASRRHRAKWKSPRTVFTTLKQQGTGKGEL